jgi:hydroxymethylbilane synthase
MAELVVGTRPSALARRQTQMVIAQLGAAWPGLTYRLVTLTTEGDRVLDRPLPEIGGKGLFTQAIEAALRSGEIDLAVHSLKDLPTDESPGLVVGAITEREDARDVLVSRHGLPLERLPSGARVGTSSLRRSAQVLALRPDVEMAPLRGNVDTRLRKATTDDYDAIILAAAGVIRLGRAAEVTQWLSFDMMLPAPGQGALAVQVRADDEALLKQLIAIHHQPTWAAVTAERAFLAALDAGCSAPVAAWSWMEAGRLWLDGLVASADGRQMVRVSAQGDPDEPAELGARLAAQARAQGADRILEGRREHKSIPS